ncbi:MAG: hypothetical protein AAB367_04235 [Patescibacteria group bacterium]|mgnify:CR=1 FL=1
MALRIALFLISLVAILGMHVASISPERDWYNSFWWLDLVLHFAGGAWVACLFLVFVRYTNPLAVIFFATIVALCWEILEYQYNVPFFGVGEASFADSLWILDTIIDIALAVTAATIVAVLASRYTKHNV